MLANQKLILLLSLIVLSSVATEEEFDKRIEEKPRLIGITKDIIGKKKQEIGLIFQNSNLSPKGFQSLYIREKVNNTLYIIPLSCRDKMPYAKGIMGVFCEADLKTPNVNIGNYIIECIKYKDIFFLDEKTPLEIVNSENGNDLELIGIDDKIRFSQVRLFFNYNNLVEPNLIKALKFADERKEYEVTLRGCFNSSNYNCMVCIADWPKLEIGKYEVKYIAYDNRKMQPKNPIFFNFITKDFKIIDFPGKIERNKNLKLRIRFTEGFDDPIDFYFKDKEHSYILYKIAAYPIGEWDIDDSTYDFKCYRNFIFDTENIPAGTYKLEYDFQKVRTQTNIIFEVIN